MSMLPGFSTMVERVILVGSVRRVHLFLLTFT